VEAKAKKTFDSNHLFGSRAFLKTDYLTRDVAAAKGLYGNSLEEAWCGGYDGNGRTPATIHFAKGQLPPAKFFWSMTLYTLPDRFLYANALNRYSTGDRSKGLVYAKDGSLTLYLSHTSPGADKEANWLPTPQGRVRRRRPRLRAEAGTHPGQVEAPSPHTRRYRAALRAWEIAPSPIESASR
jgi:hypothetical protein